MSVATQVRSRQGTTAENAAFTGAAGEVVYDTQAKRLIVHDGATLGGAKVMKFPTDSGITVLNFGVGPYLVLDGTLPASGDTIAGSSALGIMFELGPRPANRWGFVNVWGDQIGGRMGEYNFFDRQGAQPRDGGQLVVDYTANPFHYQYGFAVQFTGIGVYAFTANVSTLTANNDIAASNNFIAQGSTGFTGDLNDSTSVKIADVVGGIITAVYF